MTGVQTCALPISKSPQRADDGARVPHLPGSDLPGLLRLLDPLFKIMEHAQHRLHLAPGTQAKAQDHTLRGDPAGRVRAGGGGDTPSVPPGTHTDRDTHAHTHINTTPAHGLRGAHTTSSRGLGGPQGTLTSRSKSSL